jgi:hypothetical protein
MIIQQILFEGEGDNAVRKWTYTKPKQFSKFSYLTPIQEQFLFTAYCHTAPSYIATIKKFLSKNLLIISNFN